MWRGDMKIAYLILCHKNLEQIKRLVHRLSTLNSDIYIHMDKKTHLSKEDICKLKQLNNGRIYFAANRFKTYLFSYSLISATLELIRLAHSRGNYGYYVLLSAQDYPIKSTSYIKSFFEEHYPKNFIEGDFAKNHGSWCCQWGRHKYHQKIREIIHDIVGHHAYFSKIGSVLRFPIWLYDRLSVIWGERPINELKKIGFNLVAGTAWWMLTDEVISYILDEVTKNPALVRAFRTMQVPEECFFQTLIIGSEKNYLPLYTREKSNKDFASRLTRSIHRLIYDFKETGQHCGGHPFNFTIKDINLLKQSDALFARKFDLNIDRKIFDMVDAQILS